MRAFLDDVELSPERGTVAGAIEAGRVQAEGAGRVVIEVLADGASLSGAALEAPSDEAGAVAEVRMVSADPAALVRETLLDTADALEASRAEHASAAEAIQSGEGGAALRSVGELLEVWQAARRAIDQGSALLGVDLTGGGEPARGLIDGLAAELEALRVAVTTQDWSTVADVVGYDLEPRAEAWVTLLREAAGRVGNGSAGTGA